MYLSHFGLREFPFSITPDTEFYFASKSYQEALNTLLIAVHSGEGFIKITGEVGTGKTLLCRKLMASLRETAQPSNAEASTESPTSKFKVAYIPNPYLEPQSLLMMLANELSVEVANNANQHEVLKAITFGLLNFARQGKKVVVCLDEVQAMPIETLEALRLLSNLETEKRKLIQVVIFGQPELEEKLNHQSIRQLKQRITFDYELSRLDRDELQYYLNHRLSVAGYRGGRMFSPGSLRLLYVKSGGIPRLVNILAHKSLLAAYGKGLREVTLTEMSAAINDTKSANYSWFDTHMFPFKMLPRIFFSYASMLLTK